MCREGRASVTNGQLIAEDEGEESLPRTDAGSGGHILAGDITVLFLPRARSLPLLFLYFLTSIFMLRHHYFSAFPSL